MIIYIYIHLCLFNSVSNDEVPLWRRIVFGNENIPDPDYPVDHVPQSERRSLLSVSIVLIGFVFFVGTMFAGAEVGSALGFSRMLSAMAIGYSILGIYVAVLSAIGASTGLTTVLLARYTFGEKGAKWADLLLGGTQIGWFGVNIPLIAVPMATYLGVNTFPWLTVIVIAWGVVHLSTAYFGYRGMELLSYIAVPALIVIALLSMYYAVGDAGGIDELASSDGTGSMPYGVAITIVIGTYISGGTQTPNWARFAETRRIGFWAGLIAFLLGNGFLFLSGALGGIVYDTGGDLFATLSAQGLALVGLVALALSVWTTADNAAYSFGVAGAEAFDYDRKRPFILGGACLGTFLAVVGAGDLFLPWLETLGLYIPPIGAVIIADFLLIWQLDVPRMDEIEFMEVRWIGVIAYVVGCLVAVLTSGTLLPGIGVPQMLPGIAALNGIIIAIGVQVAGHYLFEKRGIVATHLVDENTPNE